MTTTAKTLKDYWAIIVTGVAVSMAVGAGQLQLNAQGLELWDLSDSVDENEDAIEQIQRLLIRRQGEVALQVQRIENEQNSQGDDLSKILLILQQLQAQGR